jgi:hypothetical protein
MTDNMVGTGTEHQFIYVPMDSRVYHGQRDRWGAAVMLSLAAIWCLDAMHSIFSGNLTFSAALWPASAATFYVRLGIGLVAGVVSAFVWRRIKEVESFEEIVEMAHTTEFMEATASGTSLDAFRWTPSVSIG